MSSETMTKPVPKGTVIFRENDQGGEMYIILKGSVTITMNCDGRLVKVAEIPQGGFFGEMSLLEGQPHTANAMTSSDSILMVVTKDNFTKIIAENPDIAVRIMKGLSSRVRELNNRLKKYKGFDNADEATLVLAEELCAVGDSLEESRVSVYAGRETELIGAYLLNKDMTCPICGHKFKFLWLRDSKLKQVSRTKELRVTYQDIEPIYHDICVCPQCFFARARMDFQQANHLEKKELAELKSLRAEKYSMQFTDIPTLGYVIKSYKLAIECYGTRTVGKTDDKIAGMWMRLAWIFDDLGEEEKAFAAREEALEKYKSSYTKGTGSEEIDHKVEYLVGNLSYSLGKMKDARDFIFKAATRRNGHKMIQQMAKDVLEDIKDA